MNARDSSSKLHRTFVFSLLGGVLLVVVIALWWFRQQTVLTNAYQQWLSDNQTTVSQLVASIDVADSFPDFTSNPSSNPSSASASASGPPSLSAHFSPRAYVKTLAQQINKLKSFSSAQIPWLVPTPTVLPAFTHFQDSVVKITSDEQALASQEQTLASRQAHAGQWFTLLQGVATQLTALQNQASSASPPLSATTLGQHKEFLLSLPRQLDGASASALLADAREVDKIVAQLSTLPSSASPVVQTYQDRWHQVADLLRQVASLPAMTQTITASRANFRAQAVALSAQLSTLSKDFQGQSTPAGYILLGVAIVLLLLASLLFARYSTEWLRQSVRGRVAGDRFEAMEVDAKDVVRQMSGIYRADMLKTQVYLEPLDNKNSLLVPLVKIVNQVLVTIGRLLGQFERGLEDIHKSVVSSASAQQIITVFSQRHRASLATLQKNLNQVKASCAELVNNSSHLNTLLSPQSAQVQGCHDVVQSLKLLGEDLRQNAFSATKQTKKLGESTQTLSLTEFTHLAAQLQVLATNILLESIPLGDKGKRFNLLAHEIQQLSNSLAQAAKQSEVVVNKVQEDIHVLSANAEFSAAGLARSNAQLNSLGEDLSKLLANSLTVVEQFQFVNGSLTKLSSDVDSGSALQEVNNEEAENFHHQVIILTDNLHKAQQILLNLHQASVATARSGEVTG